MRTTRRKLLTGASVVLGVAAGCSESLEQTGSTGPEYDPEEDELPQFSADYLDGDGWNREPGEEEAEDYDRIYARYGDSETWDAVVGGTSRIEETVEEAQSALEEIFVGVREEEFELADEAYWADEDTFGIAVFRHFNALGIVAAAERTGLQATPDTRGAIDIAERWFEEW